MPFAWLLQRNSKTIFWLVVCVTFCAFFVVHSFTLLNGDEGVYVLYAKQMSLGKIPVADYEARSPILLFFILLFSKIFGSSIFVFRLPVIIASSFTAGILYLLGKDMFSRRVGIIAGLLYGLNPYVLWSDIVLKSEMFCILFTTLAAYFFVTFLKKEKKIYLFVAGLCVALAFLERHSGVVFGGVMVAYIFWKQEHVIQRLAILAGAFFSGFLSLFLLIGFHNFANAFQFWFGVSLTLIMLQASRSVPAAQGLFSYALVRDWGLVFVEDLAPQAWILFSGLVAFLVLFGEQIFERYRRVKRAWAWIIIALFMGSFIEHAAAVYFLQSDLRPEVFGATLIFTLIFFVSLMKIIRKEHIRVTIDMSVMIFLWMSALVILYSFWNARYLREFIPPMTLAAACVLGQLEFRGILRKYFIFFFLGFIGLYLSSVWWFMDPRTGGWWWDQATMNQTARFIQEHTSPGEAVFTANPLPVFLADRNVFENLSSYAVIHAPSFSEQWSLYPSPEEILNNLKKYPPRYVVVDGRMKWHVFGVFPVFEDFINTHYKVVATYGSGKAETSVWQYK